MQQNGNFLPSTRLNVAGNETAAVQWRLLYDLRRHFCRRKTSWKQLFLNRQGRIWDGFHFTKFCLDFISFYFMWMLIGRFKTAQSLTFQLILQKSHLWIPQVHILILFIVFCLILYSTLTPTLPNKSNPFGHLISFLSASPFTLFVHVCFYYHCLFLSLRAISTLNRSKNVAKIKNLIKLVITAGISSTFLPTPRRHPRAT